MSLADIVRVLGGDLYDGGRAASVPGPGHSAADRSVSLRLVEGRVLVNSFAGDDWAVVMADLRRRGLVDRSGRLLGGPGRDTSSAPSRAERVAAARALWTASEALAGSPAEAYCRRRGAAGPLSSELRSDPAAPAAIYRGAGPRRPALLAAIRDVRGALCGVELTYLDWSGERARVAIPRKTLGTCPAGAAVRLGPVAEEMLVGEGVFTVLSASQRFSLPAWALLSAGNLRRWVPPPGVRQVLVAADAGGPGQAAALVLAARLRRAGWSVRVATPPAPFGDWNEARDWEGGRKDGRGRAQVRGWSAGGPEPDP